MPFALTNGDSSKLTLGVYGHKNYLSTATNTHTTAELKSTAFFADAGYAKALTDANVAGTKGFGKADTDVSTGGYLAFTTTSWGGYC
jgi:hypothetical protein